MGSILNVSDQQALQVPVTSLLGTTAAWALSYSGDMIKYTCDTTAEVGKIIIPIIIPKNNSTLAASSTQAIVDKIQVSYTVGTAALATAVVGEIQTVATAVDGVAPVVATVAATVAGSLVADTKTVDDHLVTLTPDTSVVTVGEASILGEISFDKAATSTVAINSVVVFYRTLIG